MWDNHKLQDEVGKVTGTDAYKKQLLLETDLSIKRISFELIQKASLVDEDD
ncbi:hypothetical protein [Lysinibacillus fusiformis]|uniref:hypothetical protein n=1 Tax=Lysinibacillus fusiformis TaxID=28031 RepID=UPI002E23A9A2|nr:hypothetical protein [Lysinibacillus fusiformis]